MVNLGLIKDAAQCPGPTPRVIVHRGVGGPAPILRAWRERRKPRVELRWNVPGGHAPASWTAPMASTVADLRWRSWWLDAHSIARTTGLSLAEGLSAWGLEFWKHYRKSGRVFIRIGEDGRDPVMTAVRAWEEAFNHIRFDERLDIDGQVRQKAEELKDKPVRRTLSRLFPALFNSL